MLRQRVVTALIAVAVLLSVLFLAPMSAARVVIGILFVAAAWEWSQFLGGPDPGLRALFVALIVLAEIALGVYFDDPGVHLTVFSTAIAWWAAALVWIFFFPTPVPRVLPWVGGLLVLAPAYLAVDWLYRTSPWLLLIALCLVWIADIGAYFTGKAFGSVKLAPRVSPGKTWEGVGGGLVLALVGVLIVTLQLGKNPGVVIPFAAAVVLVSVVGDLTVSMFKRHSGIKDSGTLFPGHGGILDRIDSLCAAAPVIAAGGILMGLF